MIALVCTLPDTLWVSGAFVKIGSDGEVAGYFYLKPGKRTVLRVVRPVNQILYMVPDTLIIYYPDHRKLFKIRSRHRFLEGGMASLTVEEENLIRAGFMFVKEDRRGDTLLRIYTHPSLKATVEIRTVNGYLSGIRARSSDGEIKVDLKGIKEVYPGYAFPDTVNSTFLTGSSSYTEKFVYYSVSVKPDSLIPDYVKRPSFPEDVEVIYRGWD